MAERTVAVALIARMQGFIPGIATGKKAVKELGGELEQLRKKSSSQFGDIRNAITGTGLALAALAGWAVKSAMEFDKQMSAVKAVSGTTGAEMGKLRQAALDAGKATVFSATQAAEAETELARAGLSTADILSGGLKGALALAAAGQLDLAEAAVVSTQAMTIWKLSGKDAGHIADVLAAGANKSVTDVHDLALGMRMAGVASSQFGIGMEETVGTLAAFAQSALRGSDAGTSLKQLLLQLAAPTGKASKLMRDLGIVTYDSQGNFVGLAKLAGQLHDKLGGLTQQQRQSALAVIFGSDAMRAANILYSQGEQGIKDWTKAVNDAGAAQRTASDMTDNLAGDVERLKGSLESLFIESSTGSTSGLRLIAEALDHLVGRFGELPAVVRNGIVVLAGASGVMLLVTAGAMKLNQSVRNATAAMAAAGPVSAGFATGLGATVKWASRAAAALAALQVAGAVLAAYTDKNLNPQIDALALSLQEFATTGHLSGEALRIIGKDAGDLDRMLAGLANKGFNRAADATSSWVQGLLGLPQPLQEAKEKAGALDQALAQMVSSGHGDTAAAVMARLEDEARKQNFSVDRLREAFPAYAGALQTAAKATDEQAAASGKATQAHKQLGLTLSDLINKGKTLTDVWSELNGAMVNSDEKTLAYREALAQLNSTLKDNHFHLKGNTLEALRNRVAMEGAAQQAVEAAQAYFEQTGDLAGATKKLQQYKQDMVKASGATGAAKKEVQDLADKLFKLPAQTNIKVNVDVYQRDHRARGSAATVDVNVKPHQAGHFAAGGYISPGQAGRVGEGPYGTSPYQELVTAGSGGAWVKPLGTRPPEHGARPPAQVAARAFASTAPQVYVNVSSVRGADSAVMAAILAGLRVDVRTKAAGSVQTYLGPRRGGR